MRDPDSVLPDTRAPRTLPKDAAVSLTRPAIDGPPFAGVRRLPDGPQHHAAPSDAMALAAAQSAKAMTAVQPMNGRQCSGAADDPPVHSRYQRGVRAPEDR